MLKSKVKKAIREGGLSTLILRTYRYLLISLLPSNTVIYNGLKVKEGKVADFLIPGNEFDDRPEYEKGIMNSMETVLEKGDKVVIVGGGRGVTASKAKNIIEEKGELIVYEPAKEMINKIKETADLNDVKIDNIPQAGIGHLENAWGNTEEAEKLEPEDLPKCDVLELDCEGQEGKILDKLEIRPNTIIVETHGKFGSPTEEN